MDQTAGGATQWKQGEITLAPPTLHIIRTLAQHVIASMTCNRLAGIPEAKRATVQHRAPSECFCSRSKHNAAAGDTPIATSSAETIVVIDPASPYEEEQQALDTFLDGLISEGRRVEIILTHLHPDHIGGAAHLRSGWGRSCAPIDSRSDPPNGDSRHFEDDLIELEGDQAELRALHRGTRARASLFLRGKDRRNYYEDLVVGIGTVVIDPPEGNMKRYFDSLSRLLSLPKLIILSLPRTGDRLGS
jgi:hypothetical protein